MAALEFDMNRVLSVGYFPTSFPRDPVEVDVFLEHILLGQVLEPLVESGTDGRIIPAVASRWTISENGKVIHFFIRDHLTFSNGKEVEAADVQYSLDRHIHSTHSQSKAYLSRIKRMTVKSPKELEMELDAPYVAIFKALSRDQLGIVPKGWIFSKNSKEPFVGTGAYRAIKIGEGWELQANPRFRSPEEVYTKTWKLILYDPSTQKIANLPVPDLLPFALPSMRKSLEHNSNFHSQEFNMQKLNHFGQVSAWWYPHGLHFDDSGLRHRMMGAIGELVQTRGKKLGYKLATGTIPQGVPGYLSELPTVPAGYSNHERSASVSIRVIAIGGEFDDLNGQSDIREIENKWNVKITLSSLDPHEFSGLPQLHPDVVTFGYAGGFHDPEGFLTVLTPTLKADLAEILGENFAAYQSASAEQDWSKRRILYENVNRQMVIHRIVAPGWRPDIYSIARASIRQANSSLSYTPKLKEYQWNTRKEVGP